MMIIYALILILLKIKDFVFRLIAEVDCLKRRGLKNNRLLHLKRRRQFNEASQILNQNILYEIFRFVMIISSG